MRGQHVYKITRVKSDTTSDILSQILASKKRKTTGFALPRANKIRMRYAN